MKNLSIALLTVLLAIAMLVQTVSAHLGGGKNGVQQCLDNPAGYTIGHCYAHFYGWVKTHEAEFLPQGN